MSNIAMAGGATGSGTVTLLAPSTSTNRTLTLPDATGTVITNTAGVVTQTMLAAGVAGNGPAFSAYPSANQNMTTGVWTKLQMNVEEFDTASCYDTSNYRFTPQVAGYYQITGAGNFSANSTNTRFLNVYKNGSSFKVLQTVAPNSINYMNVGGSCLVYLNGSTDYVELFAMQNSGGTLATSASSSEMYFQGFLARAA